jgi:hypothetical protein
VLPVEVPLPSVVWPLKQSDMKAFRGSPANLELAEGNRCRLPAAACRSAAIAVSSGAPRRTASLDLPGVDDPADPGSSSTPMIRSSFGGRNTRKSAKRRAGLRRKPFPRSRFPSDFSRIPAIFPNFAQFSLERWRHGRGAAPRRAILITAYPDDTMHRRALSAGVVAYLIKPFSEDNLPGCLRSVLGPDVEAT